MAENIVIYDAHRASLHVPSFVGTRRLGRTAIGVATRRVVIVACMVLVGACSATPPLPDPLAAGWHGVAVCERLHEDTRQRILRCSFPPAVGHERHYHAPHFGYALAGGRMQITDAKGTRVVDLATGSSFTSPGVAWHEVLNVGDTTVTYLLVEPK
jgi:quercetin dioxygenase-like cupin family protein